MPRSVLMRDRENFSRSEAGVAALEAGAGAGVGPGSGGALVHEQLRYLRQVLLAGQGERSDTRRKAGAIN